MPLTAEGDRDMCHSPSEERTFACTEPLAECGVPIQGPLKPESDTLITQPPASKNVGGWYNKSYIVLSLKYYFQINL